MQQNIQQSVRRALFIFLVIVITIAFFGVIREFLLACFWATVLATLFFNVYRRIRIKTHGRDNLSAALTTTLILLVVVIPALGIIGALVNEMAGAYEHIKGKEFNVENIVRSIDEKMPFITKSLQNFAIDPDTISEWLKTAIISATETLANQAVSYTQNAINAAIQFAVMLYLLFFFFRDGRMLIRYIINALPLGNRLERQLLGRFASVARATVKGTLIVATIQGSLGGLLFWAVGIPGAVFWGVVMTLLSILPIGSGFVWGPAAAVFLFQGEIVKALIIIAVGALIIGLVDNLLRPVLVGRDTKMPDFIVLLTTLGGLSSFGLSGFVIGPVIAAMFISVWEVMGKEYGGRAR